MEEYSEELIEEIKESIDIVDFIGEYVELKKKGREYFGNFMMKERDHFQ